MQLARIGASYNFPKLIDVIDVVQWHYSSGEQIDAKVLSNTFF